VTLQESILDEMGGSFRAYERDFDVRCDDSATAELDTLACGVPTVGIACPDGYGCEDGVCRPNSCEQVFCAENEVCNSTALRCEPDCRLWGGSLFCAGSSICLEDGTCSSE